MSLYKYLKRQKEMDELMDWMCEKNPDLKMQKRLKYQEKQAEKERRKNRRKEK